MASASEFVCEGADVLHAIRAKVAVVDKEYVQRSWVLFDESSGRSIICRCISSLLCAYGDFSGACGRLTSWGACVGVRRHAVLGRDSFV